MSIINEARASCALDGETICEPERCEWNPVTHAGAFDPPTPTDCKNAATVVLGRRGEWHVCETCAADPSFKRFRVRKHRGVRYGGKNA